MDEVEWVDMKADEIANGLMENNESFLTIGFSGK